MFLPNRGLTEVLKLLLSLDSLSYHDKVAHTIESYNAESKSTNASEHMSEQVNKSIFHYSPCALDGDINFMRIVACSSCTLLRAL